MKTIAQQIATTLNMTFLYARANEANVTLDNSVMPVMILKETTSGKMLLEGNSVWQLNSYEIEFLNACDMQDTSVNNDVIMQAMLVKSVSFIKSLSANINIEGKITDFDWITVKENIYDANVIGVRLTFEAKINPTNRCD